MQTFSVRTLEETDIEALLRFETHNREWFESQIDARAPSFYSRQGVTDHIERYLSDFALGTWHPFVIEEASEGIVGRANLKTSTHQRVVQKSVIGLINAFAGRDSPPWHCSILSRRHRRTGTLRNCWPLPTRTILAHKKY